MSAEKQTSGENIFKILIATDKFKGSLTSGQAGESIAAGVRRAFEEIRFQHHVSDLFFDIVEIADGGDGSAAVVRSHAACGASGQCREVFCEAVDPLGKIIRTSYLLYGEAAFIEMARISGLELLPLQERNPLHTTTYGLGQVILHALGNGVREIILSIGGSATNDGGTGMLQALGFQFMDASGMKVGAPYLCGGDLERIATVVQPERLLVNGRGEQVSLKVICDVTNPLLGENGATWVYGAQKGANPKQQQQLEAGMAHYVRAAAPSSCADPVLFPILPARYATLPGSGAAGGVGFAATCYLGGELVSGWRFFAEITQLEERIASAHLVISGEGRIDTQSFQGKVVDGVAQLAAKHHKPLVLFCGKNELDSQTLPANTYIYTLNSLEPNPERSMSLAGELLTRLAAQAVNGHPEFFQPG